MQDDELDVYTTTTKQQNNHEKTSEDAIENEDETNSFETKQQRLQEKREARFDRLQEKKMDRELKELEYEEKHPGRVKLRRRTKSIGKGIKKQVEGAWQSTKQVAHEVKVQRMRRGQYPYGAPKVLPRPRGMRMAPGPASRSSNMSREEAVTSTVERDLIGGGQPQQERTFFGPPKLLDLMNTGASEKQEIDFLGGTKKLGVDDLIGNSKNKKKTRYY